MNAFNFHEFGIREDCVVKMKYCIGRALGKTVVNCSDIS